MTLVHMGESCEYFIKVHASECMSCIEMLSVPVLRLYSNSSKKMLVPCASYNSEKGMYTVL